jgi:phospholipid-binding lipoprotein MlaA
LDRNVLRPAAQGYDFLTPTLFQHFIGNGISHLDLTNDFANYLLQGDGERGLNTLGRFMLNTIVGAGGLLDPATEFGLPKDGTDFGITLGTYGVGEGSYLVLPVLGPSTVRDTGGFAVDRAFSPLTYVGIFTNADAVGPALTAIEIVDRRNRNADLIDQVLYESVDSYVTIRSAYLQRRRSKIADGDGAEDSLPDIFDDEAPNQ